MKSARLVDRATRAGPSRRERSDGETGRASPAASCSCAAATTTTTAATRRTFPGVERFEGELVHPQQWPEDLDYAGKRVVVIGSGATAVTLVPEMAKTAGHVTMLQRSPTYVVSRPAEDALANWLRRWLPAKLAYGLTRWKNVLFGMCFFQPGAQQAGRGEEDACIDMVRARSSAPTTTSRPTSRRATTPGTSGCAWCPTPTCSRRSSQGTASVVTDQIETFTETGIRLKSGAAADGRHHRHRHRPEPAGDERHASSSSTARRSISAEDARPTRA